MTGPDSHAGQPQPARNWAALAAEAAADVNTRFGHRLMGLPGTWIGSLEAHQSGDSLAPASAAAKRLPKPWSEWHYWWQSHYLDAIVDTGNQALTQGDQTGARRELQHGKALLRGILIRNFCRFPNHYYDDMAWLALAATRLNELSLHLTAKPARLARFAARTLTKQLHKAHDPVLGGGLYWSRKRDYKNTPVNGPAAAHFARLGEHQIAGAVADWLRTELFDAETGLYLDGVHPSAADRDPALGRDVEATIYTYNQGPILGALLKLGRPQDLIDADTLIDAIGRHLHTPGQGLRLESGGDGSLFTGILCRYLALAAQEERLRAQTRATASKLIHETAATVADQHPEILSAAIQRWTILSAAAEV